MDQAALDAGWNLLVPGYRDEPTAERAVVLRRYAWYYLRSWPKPGLASLGVFLGLMDGISERHARPGLFNLAAAAGSLFLRSRPAASDYWLVRWLVTRSRPALLELHRRARHLELPAILDSALWVIRSYRLQDADFDIAMTEIETGCRTCRLGDQAGPFDGDRVVFCRHFDASPEYLRLNGDALHLYYIGDGYMKRSDGVFLRSRWLALCPHCQRVAVQHSPLSLADLCSRFAFQDSDWVGAAPRGSA